MTKDNKIVGDVVGEDIGTPMETTDTPKQPDTSKVVVPVQAKTSGVYNTIDEVPEVFRPAVRAALKKVGFNGRRILPDGELGLTDERLWVLDMLYNCGMFR